jgi:hypothetical protein
MTFCPRWSSQVGTCLALVFGIALLLTPAASAVALPHFTPYDASASAYDRGTDATRAETDPEYRQGRPDQSRATDSGRIRSQSPRGVAAKAGRGADFIASADGVVLPTSRSRMVGTFEEAGLPSSPTTSAGTQYTLPDGSLVRVMEPSGQTPLRASFTNANGGPVSPFTGKPVQPPSGLSKADRLDYIRSRTHIELGP